jgi:uncharacterized membrane protein (UPF0127 family)
MRQITIINQAHSQQKRIQAQICSSFLCRLRGLMFTSQLPRNLGLMLVEKRESRLDASIHMFFVNYDLAIVWIDHNHQVVDTRIAHRWRPFYIPSNPACYILIILPILKSEMWLFL